MTAASLASGITIEYETFGNAADPAVLLVAGYGSQLISWPVGLCNLIAGAGRYVVRFDNRDAGLSTQLDDRPVDMRALQQAAASGGRAAVRDLAPYTLSEMGDDAVGLLD